MDDSPQRCTPMKIDGKAWRTIWLEEGAGSGV